MCLCADMATLRHLSRDFFIGGKFAPPEPGVEWLCFLAEGGRKGGGTLGGLRLTQKPYII